MISLMSWDSSLPLTCIISSRSDTAAKLDQKGPAGHCRVRRVYHPFLNV
uniref:Uncharacterized protein n=1 Tax=Anguilla anguilla TaxID=7936 RepID=A0A0E9PQ66_ANGAN